MRPFSPPSCLLAPWLQFEERESHRVTGPSEQLWPNFVFAQLCRAESSQTPALLARDSPRILGNRSSWCCSRYPEAFVSAGLLVPGMEWEKALGTVGREENISNWRCKGGWEPRPPTVLVPGAGIGYQSARTAVSLQGLVNQLTSRIYIVEVINCHPAKKPET